MVINEQADYQPQAQEHFAQITQLVPVKVPIFSPQIYKIQFVGNRTRGYIIEFVMLTRFTSSSLTLQRLCVIGAIALNAWVDTELQRPARINSTRFTYLYLDGFTSLNYIIFIIQFILVLLMTKIYLAALLIILSLGYSLQTTAPLTGPQEDFINKVKSILESHLVQGQKWGMKYHFYRPGLQKYGPFQWLWDSAFHMIAWSHINVTNSILDIKTMLQKQNNRTFEIPEMIFWGHEGIKDKILNPLLNSDPTVTDISQMPMLAFSLERIYEQTKNKTLLGEILPKLVQYYEWWARMRQPDRDGLIVIIHPWQSGLDASPMYDEALGVKNPKPSLKQFYPQFEKLIINYKLKYKWDQSKIIAPKSKPVRHIWPDYFVVKEVGVNAVYAASWKILANLAHQIGNQPLFNYCMKQYKHFVQGIQSLFDEEKGRYVSKYRSGKQFKTARADTVQSLFPILIPQIKKEHQNAILNALKDEKRYRSAYPIPTVSQSDPAFNPIFTIDLMWRGPSWAAPNYFVLEGLRRLNQTSLYKEIGQKWVNQALTKDLWEMWNPLTGEGYGVKDLGMSTSVVDIIYKLKQIQSLQ